MRLILSKYICILLFLLIHGVSFSQVNNPPPKREFRATWVSTVYNLDWPSKSGLSVKEQQLEFKYMLDQNQKLGLNAIIVQIRTTSDAFYKSSYEPWSQYLTGKQGQDPGYDPLQFMLEECHKRNMEFHAWFNLFRGTPHKTFIPVTKQHITKKRPDWFFEYKSGLYFDPGIPEAREYLLSVIMEVVENYDIDGVHIDDYFYPNEITKDHKIGDKKTFRKHKGEFRKIQDWRRENINIIIRQIYRGIKMRKPHVKFGISPFPVWRHKYNDSRGSETDRTSACYDHFYADTRKWVEKGWVDYLAPQFYWGHQFKRVPFHVITSWWNEHNYGRPIYAGLAYYKLNNSQINPHSDPSWTYQDEIFEQVERSRKLPNLKGVVFYSQGSFNQNRRMYTSQLEDDYFNRPALQPRMPWLDSIPPLPPSNLTYTIKGDSVILNWDRPIGGQQEIAHSFILYAAPSGKPISFETGANILGITNQNQWKGSMKLLKNHIIYIRSLDRLHNESDSFMGLIIKEK